MATETPDLPASVATDTDPVLALLQPWIDQVPKPQRRLGLFIFLALLGHMAIFFFIRIDTTRAELRRQPPTHVTVEDRSTSSPAQARDPFWDRLTDPRLFLLPITESASSVAEGPAPDLASLHLGGGPASLPAPAHAANDGFLQQVVSPLEQRAAAAMTPARQPFFYDEAPRVMAKVTTWQWEAPLAERQPANVPDLPSPVSDTDLMPTELNVAIDAEGTVQHVLVEQGCGKLDLDQQAVLAARKIRFRAGDQAGLLWGRVVIFWNYAAAPREEVVPTPISSPESF